MLLLLAGIIYTCFICWAWGMVAWKGLQKMLGGQSMGLISFPEQSLLGFIFITTLGSIANFVIPLGGWFQQGFLLTIALLGCWRFKGLALLQTELGLYVKMKWTAKLLLIIAVGWIVSMGSWQIIHPDSLGYHFPLIRWSADHVVTPGLANLHIRFGYQSSWFIGSALFDPGFLSLNSISFINGAVLWWFVAFSVKQLYAFPLYEEEKGGKILWILLLFISGWAYTLFRLTASSASPDFINALLIWYIFYLFLHTSSQPIYRVWIIILILFSFTVKLSSAPLLLLLAFILLENKLWLLRKYVLPVTLILVIMMSPFLIRNHITSGYLFFPSSAVHVGEPDWRVPAEKLDREASYVKAYARLQVEGDINSIQVSNQATLQEWIPEWFRLRSEAEIIILAGTLIMLLTGLLRYRKMLKMPLAYKMVLFTSLSGIVCWFLLAPDPRFGWGFLIGFIALILYPLTLPDILKRNEKIFLDTGLYILLGFGLAYLAYRIYNYSNVKSWVKPVGVIEQQSQPLKAGTIDMIVPIPGNGCGNRSQPCTYDSIPGFEPRGSVAEEGFRPITNR